MKRDGNLKWHFPRIDNMAGRGENDPQRELFPGHPIQTLVRESIQNSLDHPLPESNQPVRVEFSLRYFPTEDFPSLVELRDEHIKICYNDSKADRFASMLKAMQNPMLCILEVADFNTTGMNYDYSNDTGGFKQFVRYTGDPNKKTGAGGSHGYGKIAYFNLSEISTILVSSMCSDGQCTFEGVSRLATHSTGVIRQLFYDTGFLDNKNGAPIQEDVNNLHDIPEDFRRTSTGSTVSILFADINDSNIADAFKIACESVLRNFFAAIQDGYLEVNVNFGSGYEQEFTADKLESIFQDRFFQSPTDDTRSGYIDRFNPHPYWLAYHYNDVTINEELSEAEAIEQCAGKKYICFKKDLPIIGKSALYINVEANNGNDMVVFMRCPRMVVAEQHNKSSKGYSAVFLCDDDREGKGNYMLRLMEDAAHRTWSKKQLRFDKRGPEMIDHAGKIEIEMRDFIHKCLDIVFPPSQTDTDDVELEDFSAPLVTEEEATNPLLGDIINKQGENDNIQGSPVDSHVGTIGTSRKSSYIGKAQVIEKKRAKKAEEKTDITGGHNTDSHVTPKPHTPSSGNENFTESEEAKERTVREKFTVKYRIFSDVDQDGRVLFTLIVHSPITEANAYLKITPVGETEDNTCNVNIKTASIGKIRENELSKVPLVEGKNVITFTVDNEGEYAFSLAAEHDVTIKE